MFRLFEPYPQLTAVLSERSAGNMWLFVDDQKGEENRIHFLASHGLDSESWVRSENVHDNQVAIVSPADKGTYIAGVDGLISTAKNLVLMSAAADCLPIYFFDPQQRVIGLAHAGWRGVAANIVGVMIERLITDFHSRPEDVLVGIGAGISKCHFTVQPDVAQQFEAVIQTEQQYSQYVETDKEGLIHVDLKGIVSEQLLAKGVISVHIEIDPACTYCQQEKYFSRRRDLPKLEAMIAVLGLK